VFIRFHPSYVEQRTPTETICPEPDLKKGDIGDARDYREESNDLDEGEADERYELATDVGEEMGYADNRAELNWPNSILQEALAVRVTARMGEATHDRHPKEKYRSQYDERTLNPFGERNTYESSEESTKLGLV
jgi:hypothetical protein